jgi:hypothetical protein
MKFFTRLLLAIVATTAFGGVASAATLVVNCSTVSGPTELSGAAMLCPQFNLAGTVTSISITISGTISGSVTLTNGDDAAATAVATTTTQYSVGALSGFSFVNPLFTNSFTTGNRSLNAGQTLTVSGLSDSGNATIEPNTTVFAPYVGAGNFTIPVTTSTSFAGTITNGFPLAAQATNASATAVVTYTYSP